MNLLALIAEYGTVARLFGVGKSTVSECVRDGTDAIINVLMDSYVCFLKEHF